MTVESILPSASKPVRVGEYLCLAVLGSGAMARVYLARPLAGGPPVALKLLHRRLGRDPGFVSMVLEEARLVGCLEHPCVARLQGVGAHAGRPFLVLDYIEGDSVESFVQLARSLGKRLPVPVALRVAVDALEGLDAAHGARDAEGVGLSLVHRDVKPGNLLAGVDGRVRVVDFGVARGRGPSLRAQRTRTGHALGTVAYMSPEQVAGRAVDARTDQWSLAVTLWECLSLRPLFEGATPMAVAAAIAEGAWERLEPRRGDLPRGLDAVLARALERDPARRYASAGELREALLGCAGEAVASARELAVFVAAMAAPRVAGERRALATAAMGFAGPLCRPRSRRPVQFADLRSPGPGGRPPERAAPAHEHAPDALDHGPGAVTARRATAGRGCRA
ncbi:MAG: serine/threonine protein kinase [Deltaproteobacteria bacterium]|nr:serine/threonine protein kinase [Deltaproteobacteria bacterium]